jgi:acetyltransferase-like isoleucine patch superfamily enzyme
MTQLFSILWMICVYVLMTLLSLPTVLLVMYIQSPHSLMLTGLLPITVLLGIFNCLLFCRLFYYLVPLYKDGVYSMFKDKNAVLWAVNNAPATIVLKWLQSTLFLNDILRYLILKALDCDVHYSSWITSNTHLSDLRHIKIGRNTLIGEKCFICASIQVQKNKLRVARISIGSDVFIGYQCEIGPGATIENHVDIQSKVVLTINNHIGSHSVIGAGTVLLPNAKIGNNVRIGMGCIIRPGAKVADNSVIADGMVVQRHG